MFTAAATNLLTKSEFHNCASSATGLGNQDTKLILSLMDNCRPPNKTFKLNNNKSPKGRKAVSKRVRLTQCIRKTIMGITIHLPGISWGGVLKATSFWFSGNKLKA